VVVSWTAVVQEEAVRAVHFVQGHLAVAVDKLAGHVVGLVADRPFVVAVGIRVLAEEDQLAVGRAGGILLFAGGERSLAVGRIVVAGRRQWREERWRGGGIGLVECRVQYRCCMLVARLVFHQLACSH
jgi:hypothetical protein